MAHEIEKVFAVFARFAAGRLHHHATFTRMTPSEQPRNANNLYPVEVAFNSPQQSLRWDSLKPYVLVEWPAAAAAPGADGEKPLGRARSRAAHAELA